MTPERSAPPWRPLLTGSLAGRALEAVEEIAADLRRWAGSPESAASLPLQRPAFSLSGGFAGQALFFAYLERAFPGQGHGELALGLLERAFDAVGEDEAPPGLFSGFTGVAWTAEHLLGDEEDPGEEIASTVAALLSLSPWPLDVDLIGGLVGYGVYALERLPRPFGRECLERTVARLAETGEPQPEGIAWWTYDRKGAPGLQEGLTGYFNLGVAHGVPGVIGLLGRICASGGDGGAARALLERAVSWLLAQRNLPGAPSRLPYTAAPGWRGTRSRVAWCYSDLGIAAALLTAARGAREPGWEEAAVDLARSAASCPFEDSGVVDAGLCHGAAGNAHLFHRLYRATGEAGFAAAACSWFERVLEMRRPGEGIGGFEARVPDDDGEVGWRNDPGFLTGSAGIGLALLAAVTSAEPAWDRLLLASIPAADTANDALA